MTEIQFVDKRTKIAELVETFYDKLEAISKFKVNIQLNMDEDSKFGLLN